MEYQELIAFFPILMNIFKKPRIMGETTVQGREITQDDIELVRRLEMLRTYLWSGIAQSCLMALQGGFSLSKQISSDIFSVVSLFGNDKDDDAQKS